METSDATRKCEYCGQPEHGTICPTIKAIEYHESGAIKRVEFKTAADYAMPPIPYYPSPAPQPYNPWPIITRTYGGTSRAEPVVFQNGNSTHILYSEFPS